MQIGATLGATGGKNVRQVVLSHQTGVRIPVALLAFLIVDITLGLKKK